MPKLAAGARVHRPGVVGNGEIQHAIYFEWRGFDLVAERTAAASLRSIDPSQTEVADVARVDLRECAVTLSGIVAIVSGPSVGGRLEKLGWVQRLRSRQSRGDREQQNTSYFHFSVSRKARTLCMSASVYCFNNSACAFRGSCTVTWTPLRSVVQERYSPAESFKATLKSSRYSKAPE